jgi:alpha-beta hydrolase superfamily lysophospholipase
VIEAAREETRLESWDALVELLRAERLDQSWTLAAYREAVRETDDGAIETRADPTARGAAIYELSYARPSDSWPAIGAAKIPVLPLLATEPPGVGEANDRLVARFLDAVPDADVVPLDGCRHQVFADLGARAGELVADWLARRKPV